MCELVPVQALTCRLRAILTYAPFCFFFDIFLGHSLGGFGSISGSKPGPKSDLFRVNFWARFWNSFLITVGSDSGSFGVVLCIHGAHKMLALYCNLQHFMVLGVRRWGPEGASEAVWFWVLVFVVFWAKCMPVLDPTMEPRRLQDGIQNWTNKKLVSFWTIFGRILGVPHVSCFTRCQV